MNVTPQAFSWYVFGGAILIFLGMSLFCDAEEKAKLTGEWRALQVSGGAEAAGPPDTKLIWVHRLFGLTFVTANRADTVFAGNVQSGSTLLILCAWRVVW